MWMFKYLMAAAFIGMCASQTMKCQRGFKKVQNDCFGFMKPAKTWTEARTACNRFGGRLAVIYKSSMIKSLQDAFPGSVGWIGLSWTGRGPTLKWISGKTADKVAWGLKQPRGLNRCVKLRPATNGLGLENALCRTKDSFFCQAKPLINGRMQMRPGVQRMRRSNRRRRAGRRANGRIFRRMRGQRRT